MAVSFTPIGPREIVNVGNALHVWIRTCLMFPVLVALWLAASPARASEAVAGPDLRPGARLRLELDRFVLFEDVPVGEVGEIWVRLQNTGSVPLRLTEMRWMVDTSRPAESATNPFEAITKSGWWISPHRYPGRMWIVGNSGTDIPVRLRYNPAEAGTTHAWLLVRAEPGGFWWAFEVVGNTPGEPPPNPGTPPDQLVRIGKGGVPRLTRSHAAWQVDGATPGDP